jgi:hypothetical protein
VLLKVAFILGCDAEYLPKFEALQCFHLSVKHVKKMKALRSFETSARRRPRRLESSDGNAHVCFKCPLNRRNSFAVFNVLVQSVVKVSDKDMT